jgi:hypothetical protein
MFCLYSSPELKALGIDDAMLCCADNNAHRHAKSRCRSKSLSPSFLNPSADVVVLTLSSTFAFGKHAFPTRLRHRQRIPHCACRNRPGFLA